MEFALISYGTNPTSNRFRRLKELARDDLRRFTKVKAQKQCGLHLLRKVRLGDLPPHVSPTATVPCKNRHSCPWCTPPALASHRTKIRAKCIHALDMGGCAVLGVFTLPKRHASDLHYSYKVLLAQVAKFRRRIRPLEIQFGVRESLRTLEETYSEDTFWHPHINFVFLFHEHKTEQEISDFTAELLRVWLEVASSSGIRGVQAVAQRFRTYQTDYSMKKLSEYVTKHSYFVDELPKPSSDGKYHRLQPWSILKLARTGDIKWIRVWNHFEGAMARKQRVVYYKAKKPVRKVLDQAILTGGAVRATDS
jgi:hypothetical protein